ncbi:glycoside hydrolase family 13 protein [Enterococcus cecorum]|uniref:glycoside hydrolase family 13 protein n=1 Tax=Enterococcus cecorum TaxID=44008 RepID=UPI00148E8B38|nr:alpha-glucosidase [Enterococcus cecorum]
MERKWWETAIGYQIYPRSFYDSNNDGIGDLQGIIAKLPYIKDLGVDFIWINPIYASPNVDNGYDISDYQAIHPDFGTMEDFKELLTKAHDLGLKIVMDLVVNHTSDQHPWFQEALKGKDNPYRDYYLWADATPDRMPNDWQSFFGGSTWQYDEKSKQAYFHIFAPEQPDLNWKNPKVREEIYQMIRWWLDLGIDGFRLDAISHIQKEPWDFKITDNPWAPFMNVAGIDEYMQDLKEIFDEYPIVTIGEASGVTSKKAVKWTNREGYLDMIFELEHQVREGQPGHERINVLGWKKVVSRWQKDLNANGWNALYVENHDNPRINSILGNESEQSAKAIATAFLFMKGTPFIYQGQEIGMTNFPFTSVEQLDAKDSYSHYQELLKQGVEPSEALQQICHWTRDHSRTPMQWQDSDEAGFSQAQPWLAVNPNYQEINVAEQEERPDSLLNFYKQAIQLRKTPLFVDGNYELHLAKHPQVIAYTRNTAEQSALVLVNLSDQEVVVDLSNRVVQPTAKVLLTNIDEPKLQKRMTLAPFAAMIFELPNRQGR